MDTTTHTEKPRSLIRAIGRRWPTLVALPVGVDSFFGEITPDTVSTLADAMLLLPMIYVVVEALKRRWLTWPILLAALPAFAGLKLQNVVDPSIVILAVTLAAAIWGSAHGRHREADFRLQLGGMVLFGALAVGGQLVDPDLARYLVALGWVGHGVWDIVHLIRDKVVARSFAEWCAVVDFAIGGSLILVPLWT
ncbi:hypothetical protein [Tenggerimyces flavus]|uniref:Uncharacterized protein n=1 Tax=Tenggerimyces flavus TaxID=1708749 RepID=A0ABV7YF69_9ACTN|nr:hypothetical protein [Tenggerimyces flavus]MBM7784235.1 hypothetical protein [Tenggerimyces flavus]